MCCGRWKCGSTCLFFLSSRPFYRRCLDFYFIFFFFCYSHQFFQPPESPLSPSARPRECLEMLRCCCCCRVADKRIRRWSAHIARPHFYTIFTLSHLALWVNYLDPAVMEGGTGYIQTTSRWWPSSLYSCWLVAAHNGNQIGAQFLYRYRQWLKILDQHSKKMGPPPSQKKEIPTSHTHTHTRLLDGNAFRCCCSAVDSRPATSQMAAEAYLTAIHGICIERHLRPHWTLDSRSRCV